MSEYAVMPYDDYKAACDALRAKDGSSDVIKSGELAAKISALQAGSGGGFATGTYSGEVDTNPGGEAVKGITYVEATVTFADSLPFEPDLVYVYDAEDNTGTTGYVYVLDTLVPKTLGSTEGCTVNCRSKLFSQEYVGFKESGVYSAPVIEIDGTTVTVTATFSYTPYTTSDTYKSRTCEFKLAWVAAKRV